MLEPIIESGLLMEAMEWVDQPYQVTFTTEIMQLTMPALVGLTLSNYFKKIMFRRFIMVCNLGAFMGIFVIPMYPVNSKILKIVFLGCMIGAWVGMMILTWNRKPFRVGIFTLSLLAVISFILPNAKIDKDELRQN